MESEVEVQDLSTGETLICTILCFSHINVKLSYVVLLFGVTNNDGVKLVHHAIPWCKNNLFFNP